MSLPWPLLLLLVWERTADGPRGDLLLGLTGAARMLPYVLLSWATGRLADRFRRDRLLRATLAARTLLLVAVAVALGRDRLWVAIVCAALAVACGTPAYPALAAAMPDAAGGARRRATDLLVTVEVASFVVGPAVGGLLLADPVRWLAPSLAVLLTLVAAAVVSGVRLPRPARPPTTAQGWAAPVAALWASRSGSRAVAVAGLLNLVDAVLLLALLPVSVDLWHDGGSGYGAAAATVGFGAVGAPLLWRLGCTTRTRARWGLLLLGGSLAVVPLTSGVAWAAVPLVVSGAAGVHVEGAVTETIQDAVPDAQRAGALGLTDSVMVGAGLLGSVGAPWLSSALGPRGALLALAVGSVATVAVLGRPSGAPGRTQGPAPAQIPAQREAARERTTADGPAALLGPEG